MHLRRTLLTIFGSISFLAAQAVAQSPFSALLDATRGAPPTDYRPYHEGCERNEVLACAVWAWGLKNTRAAGTVAWDMALPPPRASQLATLCTKGDGWSCVYAARLGLSVDDGLRAACAQGHRGACLHHAESTLRASSRDLRTRAASDLASLCTAGWGCASFARAWQEGITGSGSRAAVREKAYAITEKACTEGDAESCLVAAGTLTDDARKNAMTARARAVLLDRGCQLGNAEACGELGVDRYYREKTETHLAQSRAALERGCRYGHARSCVDLAELVWRSATQGTPSAENEAMQLHRWACDHGDAVGCRGSAALLARTNRAAARELLETACHMDDGLACCRLSILYLFGHDGPQSVLRFATLFARAQWNQAGPFCGLL